MKGNSEVLEVLNEVLTAELTAINQYFIHAELCQHWGYGALYTAVRAQSIGEMKHAEQVMERILYLDGIPNMQRLGNVSVGETVREQFELDAKLEHDAIERLNTGIELCRKVGDNGTRELLVSILQSEEQHVDWLDTQIGLLDRIGEERYLAQQLG